VIIALVAITIFTYILSKRVRNAPRNESRWLKGWYNRVDTYKTFQIGNPGAITADVSGK